MYGLSGIGRVGATVPQFGTTGSNGPGGPALAFVSQGVAEALYQMPSGLAVDNADPAQLGEAHDIANFADDETEFIIFDNLAMPADYDGGPCTLTYFWTSATAVVGDVLWGVEFELLRAGANISAPLGGPSTSFLGTAPAAVEDIVATSVVLSNVAMKGIAAGNPFRIFTFRVGGDATDNMIGDAALLGFTLQENP